MPLVSVILPTYNRAPMIGRAVASVLGQTFTDFELLVVDDASTDDTLQRLAAVADPRLRILRRAQNGGAAAARNQGIGAARGEWLAFQDSDDEWHPEKLASQLAAATADPAIGLVLGGYEVEDHGRRFAVRPAGLLDRGEAVPDTLDGWPTITPTWLVRRELVTALGGFDTRYPVFEDWDLVLRLTDRTRCVAVAGPILTKHGSADTLCANPLLVRDALAQVLAAHALRWRLYPSRLARRYVHLGTLQHLTGQRPAARISFARAATLQPFSPASAFWLASRLGRGVGFLARFFPRYSGMAL